MDVGKLIHLVKDHEAVYDALRCERRKRGYIASVWLKIERELSVGKRSTSVFCWLL
jgi:hypothetical protein